MNNTGENLNIRLNMALQSKTDREFYMSVYHYFDHVHQTPNLKAILDKSEKVYMNEFYGEIWKEKRKYTEEELDIRSAQVSRLERFNLYSVGCTMLVRIYWPIDDYKKTSEPDVEKDIVAVILVKGVRYALSSNRWGKKTIQMYYRWFEGKRDDYESDLKRFHLMLLDELVEPPAHTTNGQEKTSIPLRLNFITGDFSFYKMSGNFSPVGQEFKILSTLLNGESYQASYLSLLQSYNPHVETASKAHRDSLSFVIRNIKQELGILPKAKGNNFDIFKNIKKFGYRLVFKPLNGKSE